MTGNHCKNSFISGREGSKSIFVIAASDLEESWHLGIIWAFQFDSFLEKQLACVLAMNLSDNRSDRLSFYFQIEEFQTIFHPW